MPTISIQYIRHAIITVAGCGGELGGLLERMQLPARVFDDQNARLPYEEHQRLMRELIRLSGDPALGLHAGESLRMGTYGVVGYLAMHGETLRDAFQAFIEFFPLLLEGFSYSLGRGRRGYHFQLHEAHPKIGLELPGIEFGLAGLLTFARSLSSRPVDPLEVRIDREPPPHREEYARIFRCPVSFRQSENALIFSPQHLALPLRFSNPRLREVFRKLAGEELERHLRQDDLVFRVREILIAGSGLKETDLRHVARRLAMSERTLQRRLRDAGTSFARIVDKTRREQCLSLIRGKGLTLEEIAYHCGYTSAGALVRVVKRWTGMTPSAYRAAAHRGNHDQASAPATAAVLRVYLPA